MRVCVRARREYADVYVTAPARGPWSANISTTSTPILPPPLPPQPPRPPHQRHRGVSRAARRIFSPRENRSNESGSGVRGLYYGEVHASGAQQQRGPRRWVSCVFKTGSHIFSRHVSVFTASRRTMATVMRDWLARALPGADDVTIATYVVNLEARGVWRPAHIRELSPAGLVRVWACAQVGHARIHRAHSPSRAQESAIPARPDREQLLEASAALPAVGAESVPRGGGPGAGVVPAAAWVTSCWVDDVGSAPAPAPAAAAPLPPTPAAPHGDVAAVTSPAAGVVARVQAGEVGGGGGDSARMLIGAAVEGVIAAESRLAEWRAGVQELAAFLVECLHGCSDVTAHTLVEYIRSLSDYGYDFACSFDAAWGDIDTDIVSEVSHSLRSAMSRFFPL